MFLLYPKQTATYQYCQYRVPHTQQRLVGTATTSDDTNHTTGTALHDLLGTRGELDTSLALLRVLADDGNVVAGGTAESTTVANLLLDVGDDGTLRNGAEGEDVADSQGSLLSSVDELAGVHALVGDERLGDILEAVRVTEGNLGKGSAAASVVDDLFHNTANITVSLGIIEGAELGGGLVETGMGRCKISINNQYQFASNTRRNHFRRPQIARTEDRATTLPLIADHTTHGGLLRSRENSQ